MKHTMDTALPLSQSPDIDKLFWYINDIATVSSVIDAAGAVFLRDASAHDDQTDVAILVYGAHHFGWRKMVVGFLAVEMARRAIHAPQASTSRRVHVLVLCIDMRNANLMNRGFMRCHPFADDTERHSTLFRRETAHACIDVVSNDMLNGVGAELAAHLSQASRLYVLVDIAERVMTPEIAARLQMLRTAVSCEMRVVALYNGDSVHSKDCTLLYGDTAIVKIDAASPEAPS